MKLDLSGDAEKGKRDRSQSIEGQINRVSDFMGNDLGFSIAAVERAVEGASAPDIKTILQARNIDSVLLTAAAQIKKISAQIDVTIHALGILRALPHILEDGERLESVSLGAGNTGRAFDLETNLRIAEFKFIQWRGGPESIRQNGIFKDFFDLATAQTAKRRCLYLLGTHHARKFFRGGRALTSVLSKNQATRDKFIGLYGERYATVNQYYTDHEHTVEIIDLLPWLPEFVGLPTQKSDNEDAS